MRKENSEITHWYQEPYAWLVVLVPATAVAASFYTLSLAVSSDDGLVTDDYYKKGLEINRVLERDERAHALAIDAEIRLDATAHAFTVRMDASEPAILPISLRARLMHSTRAGFDQDIVLDRAANGSYFAYIPELAAGRWYAQIETAEWRVLKTFSVTR